MSLTISTITQGVYILLTLIFTVVAMGLIVLLAFFSYRERKRYKESRALDKEIKTVNLDNELKAILNKARSSTRFVVLAVHINDYALVAAEYGASGVAAMNDILYRRLLRSLHHPSSLSSYAKDKIAIIVRANISKLQLNKLMEDIIARFKADITMPGGRMINLSVNIAAVYYPNIGEDLTQVITGLEYALAESRRNGAYASVIYDKPLINLERYDYEVYQGLNRAINSRAIGMQYRRIIAVDGGKVMAVDSSLTFKGKDITAERELYKRAATTGDCIWLDMLEMRKAFMQLAPVVIKSAGKVGIVHSVTLPFIMQEGNIANIIAAAATYGITAQNIMIELYYNDAALHESSELAKIAEQVSATGLRIVIGGVAEGGVVPEVIRAIAPAYIKIDAEKLLSMGEGSQSAAEVLAAINSLDVAIIACNVDNSRVYDELSSRGIDYCMGEFPSPIIPIVRIIEEIKAMPQI